MAGVSTEPAPAIQEAQKRSYPKPMRAPEQAGGPRPDEYKPPEDFSDMDTTFQWGDLGEGPKSLKPPPPKLDTRLLPLKPNDPATRLAMDRAAGRELPPDRRGADLDRGGPIDERDRFARGPPDARGPPRGPGDRLLPDRGPSLHDRPALGRDERLRDERPLSWRDAQRAGDIGRDMRDDRGFPGRRDVIDERVGDIASRRVDERVGDLRRGDDRFGDVRRVDERLGDMRRMDERVGDMTARRGVMDERVGDMIGHRHPNDRVPFGRDLPPRVMDDRVGDIRRGPPLDRRGPPDDRLGLPDDRRGPAGDIRSPDDFRRGLPPPRRDIDDPLSRRGPPDARDLPLRPGEDRGPPGGPPGPRGPPDSRNQQFGRGPPDGLSPSELDRDRIPSRGALLDRPPISGRGAEPGIGPEPGRPTGPEGDQRGPPEPGREAGPPDPLQRGPPLDPLPRGPPGEREDPQQRGPPQGERAPGGDVSKEFAPTDEWGRPIQGNRPLPEPKIRKDAPPEDEYERRRREILGGDDRDLEYERRRRELLGYRDPLRDDLYRRPGKLIELYASYFGSSVSLNPITGGVSEHPITGVHHPGYLNNYKC